MEDIPFVKDNHCIGMGLSSHDRCVIQIILTHVHQARSAGDNACTTGPFSPVLLSVISRPSTKAWLVVGFLSMRPPKACLHEWNRWHVDDGSLRIHDIGYSSMYFTSNNSNTRTNLNN